MSFPNFSAWEPQALAGMRLTRCRKPIHGLIFLYQYQQENLEADGDLDTDGIWFANQARNVKLREISRS